MASAVVPPSSLPSPASILALQIVQAAVRPDVTVDQLVALCQHDPAFVGRLLAHVNSAAFGLNRHVTSIQHAVSLLGIRGTRNLALMACVSDMTPKGSDGSALLETCLRRAIAAKLIAHALGRKSSDDHFTVGMLLEAGLLVKAGRNLKAAADLARSPATTRPMLERASGEEDHPSLGGRLAESWNLDAEIVAAMEHHHEREPPATELCSVAWLAERLAAVFEGGDISQNRRTALESGSRLELSPRDIDGILKAIPTAVNDIANQLDREVTRQIDVDDLLRDANVSLLEINRSYADLVQRLERLLQEKERLAVQLREANEKLTTLALTDGLTALANHRAFQEALTRELARADREPTFVSLIVLDADHFKRVNDTYGHKVGDAALRTIADVLKHTVRASDMAARVGGEEFALLLPNTNAEGARVVAERVREAVAKSAIEAPKGAFYLTISLGIAMLRGPGCRGGERRLFEAADEALYVAKREGRNQSRIGNAA